MKINLKSGHKGFIFIAFIGIVLIVAGVIYQIVTERKIDEWTQIDAKVVWYEREFRGYVDSDGDWMYRSILEYTVNGTVYKERSSSLSTIRPIVGVSQKIAYNPQNPRDFIEIEEGLPVEIFLYAIGGVLTCTGVVFFLVSSCKKI